MTEEAAYLVVARFVKPHGLKGEAVVFPMTDEPDEVFVKDRVLRPVRGDGEPIGDELILVRARPFQRRWLVSFQGIETRGDLESWSQVYLGARRSELRLPDDDELYVHEVAGTTVVEGDTTVGVARELTGRPGHLLLVVDRDGREVLIPFCDPIVRRIDRIARRIEVELPPGLLEL